MTIPDKAIRAAQEAVAKRLEAWSWHATDSASRAMAIDVLLAATPHLKGTPMGAESMPGRWHVEFDNGTYYVRCAEYALGTAYETFDAARGEAEKMNREMESK